MIIDSHAHLTHPLFDQEFRFLRWYEHDFSVANGARASVTQASVNNRIIGWIEPAISFESNQSISQAQAPDGMRMYRAVGVHPTRVWLTKLRNRKKLPAFVHPDTVAIGETGLDYHYPRRKQHRLLQKLWFKYQIRLADEYKLPLILHIRQADDDALKILKRNRSRLHGGVVHCFAGGPETARKYLSLGFALGIGGTLLQEKNARLLRESVKAAPLTQLLVETDAPYVLPDFCYEGSNKSKRKIRNSPAILPRVLEEIANLKGIDLTTAEKAVFRNTIRIFRIDDSEHRMIHS